MIPGDRQEDARVDLLFRRQEQIPDHQFKSIETVLDQFRHFDVQPTSYADGSYIRHPYMVRADQRRAYVINEYFRHYDDLAHAITATLQTTISVRASDLTTPEIQRLVDAYKSVYGSKPEVIPERKQAA